MTIGQLEGWRYIRPGIRLVPCVFIFRPHNFSWRATHYFAAASVAFDLCGAEISKTIEQSIRERLYTLDARTAVVTGHGARPKSVWSECNSFVGLTAGEVVLSDEAVGACIAAAGLNSNRCVTM